MSKCDFIGLALRDIHAHMGPPIVSVGIELRAPLLGGLTETPLLRPLTWNDSSEDSPWPVVPQAQVYLGDRIAITVESDFTGYLSLFSLGAGGSSARLFPNADQPWNGMRGGELRRFSHNGGADWEILGPTTANSGRLEYILAVVARAPEAFYVHDISHRLRGHGREAAGTTGPPASASLAQHVPRLFALPREAWAYGLVALEVGAAHLRSHTGASMS